MLKMEENHKNRTLDAAAVKKRRSSILKSQRVTRTPLSELEFKVATPPEPTKSRRVSFSRRTDVAEFITNEATTTWKTFYEEHNKSLESSSNESKLKAPRQLVDNLGKCFFDQQFDEEEEIEIVPNLNNPARSNVHSSFDLTQQLASLEFTADDRKLRAPQANFELSTFTDQHSKIFANELQLQSHCEMSGGIHLNFSATQPKDDLDEIQRDMARSICQRSFIDNVNISDCIEIDLDITRMGVDDIDMSVTDTVPSPKMQDVLKSHNIDKRLNLNEDIMADKENIAIDPYAPPRESANFAVNQVSDKVLVFDGKRLTLQSAKNNLQNYHQTLIPSGAAEEIPKRKTIVLNTNDDLPNCINEPQFSNNHAYISKEPIEKSMQNNDGTVNMSTTRAVASNLLIPGNTTEKTIVYGDTTGNISITQAVPSEIVQNVKSQRRRTIIYDNVNADISVTDALPSNLLLNHIANERSQNKTVFETDNCDISMTQALPANILEKVLEKRNTILYENDTADISVTEAISRNIIQNVVDGKRTVTDALNKSATVVYENDVKSMQPKSNDLPRQEKLLPQGGNNRNTIIFKNDTRDSSIISTGKTLREPAILVDAQKNNKSIFKDAYESKKSIIPPKIAHETHLDDKDVAADKIIIEDLANVFRKEKRRTIVYENDEADISMTCAIPSNIVLAVNTEIASKRRQTIVFDDKGDVSMTKVLSHNLLFESSKIKNDVEDYYRSKSKTTETEQLPFSHAGEDIATNQTATHEFDNDVDMSITEPIPQLPSKDINTRNTTIFQRDLSALSLTRPISSHPISLHTGPKTDTQEILKCPEKAIIHPTQNVFVYQTETSHLHSNLNVQSKTTDLKCEKSLNIECINKDPVNTTIPNLVDQNVNEVSSNNNESFEVATNNLSKEHVGEVDIDMSIAGLTVSRSDFNAIDKENENLLVGNKTVLDDLLDMSTTSMEEGLVDNSLMVEIQSDQHVVQIKEICDKVTDSSESMFYIMKDSDEEAQTEKSEFITVKNQIDNNKVIEEASYLNLEYVEENPKIVQGIQQSFGELKSILQNKTSPAKNSNDAKIPISDMTDSEVKNYEKARKQSTNGNNVSKRNENANNTNQLLELISSITGDEKSERHEEDEKKPEPIMLNGQCALENKSKINDSKKITFISNSSSVHSRAEIPNSILGKDAPLHESNFDPNDTESLDNTGIDISDMKKRNVQISQNIVKTLEFNDDSDSDTSSQSNEMSPLKKIAFGETSYMREIKANVIPCYLKDIPEEMKELMHDLVKPTAESVPFEVDNVLKKNPSTCSTQIQANLIGSSQIDIHTELYSNTASVYDIHRNSLGNDTADLVNEIMSYPPKSQIKLIKTDVSDKSLETKLITESRLRQDPISKPLNRDQIDAEKVLVFDHNNPLNNVLLAPMDRNEAHKYDPIKSNETLCGSEHSDSVQVSINDNENPLEVERVSLHYNVANTIPRARFAQPLGDDCYKNYEGTQSVCSNLSKVISVDQSIDVKMTEAKDVDVNTIIAMKGNKELLEASSSLTLVDDALAKNASDIDVTTKDLTATRNKVKPNSPCNVIYQMEKHASMITETIDSDMTSPEAQQPKKKCLSNKRCYSPTKVDTHRQNSSHIEITPKPLYKMKKLSKSPLKDVSPEKTKFTSRIINRKIHDNSVTVAMEVDSKDKSTEKSFSRDNSKILKSKSKPKETTSTITVQQFITEYYLDKKCLDESKVEGELRDAVGICRSDMSSTHPRSAKSDVERVQGLDLAGSFTSSKNLNEVNEHRHFNLELLQASGCLNSYPACEHQMSSRNVTVECESSANVFAKINKLPFMGSQECRWEISTGDVWSFLLVHSRVHLSVHFGGQHDNPSRIHNVHEDTRVKSLEVEIAHYDKRNSVASVCVGFGAEAMRYVCARGACVRACDVPALVRQCGAVARVALRWGRTMHDARLQLAYTLTDDGHFSLKVANVPLRSVWEVTMRLELVVDDAREAPWPRASHVQVANVLSDYPVTEQEVQREIKRVPHDWGHVPRTVWRIFKYLKNKPRDGGLQINI